MKPITRLFLPKFFKILVGFLREANFEARFGRGFQELFFPRNISINLI